MMMSELAGVLVEVVFVNALDSIGDCLMKTLQTRRRDAAQDGLANEFMRELTAGVAGTRENQTGAFSFSPRMANT